MISSLGDEPRGRRIARVRDFLKRSGVSPDTRRRAVLLAGLPGSGKSYLAHEVALCTSAVVIRTDEVRSLLFPQPTFSSDESATVYLTCFGLVRELLRDGWPLLFDGTNGRRAGRRRFVAIGRETGSEVRLVHVYADPNLVEGRIRARTRGDTPNFASTADVEVYRRMRTSEDYGGTFDFAVDTGNDVHGYVRQLTTFLRGHELGSE